MSHFLRIAGVVLLLTVALALVGLVTGPSTPAGHAGGPYLSALSGVGAGTAWAAKTSCNHRLCEFVAPAYSCIYEGGKTNCSVNSTGGCTTVTCP